MGEKCNFHTESPRESTGKQLDFPDKYILFTKKELGVSKRVVKTHMDMQKIHLP